MDVSIVMILPRPPGLFKSPSSSSRCCQGCWDSSSWPPSAQPCCDDILLKCQSPVRSMAPPQTPTPTTGLDQMRRVLLSHQRKHLAGHLSLAVDPCHCPLNNHGHPLATWQITTSSPECIQILTPWCSPRLTQQSVTYCWMQRPHHLWTRFHFSASVPAVKALWDPKETVETGVFQACRPL